MERKPRRRRVEKPASEFEESVVAINRVTKVVKGDIGTSNIIESDDATITVLGGNVIIYVLSGEKN